MDDAGALEDFRRASKSGIHPAACKLGTVSNVLFDAAYVWSLVKERGCITGGYREPIR